MMSRNSLEEHNPAQSKTKENKCLKNYEHTVSETLASESCYRVPSNMQ